MLRGECYHFVHDLMTQLNRINYNYNKYYAVSELLLAIPHLKVAYFEYISM